MNSKVKSKVSKMKIRLHNIKWSSYFDKYPEILDTLPKEKIKEITINDFNNYGWDDDEIHRLSVGELNSFGVDMFKEIEKEHDVTPNDGSFEFHWNYSDFLPKELQKELESIKTKNMGYDINKYDLDTKRKVYEMLGGYDNDIITLTDLEDLQEIQQRLGSSEFYREEITEDELELLYDLDKTQIEELIEN